MSLSIFTEHIQQQLIKAGIKELTEEQSSILKSLKSGQDFTFENFDLDEILDLVAFTLIQRVKADETELLPRALVLGSDIDICVKLEEKINLFAKITGLVSIVTHDKGKRIEQRNNLYNGVDVVIGNPKRVGELYFQNGINLKHLKIIILLDANKIAAIGGFTPIMRLDESMVKCQKIVFHNEINAKMEDFMEEFLINPKNIIK